MNHHSDKRLKHVIRDLQYWRKTIIRSFEEVNKGHYSEADGREFREKVNRDRKLVKHIDPLIMAASEILEIDPPNLDKLPRVTLRHR